MKTKRPPYIYSVFSTLVALVAAVGVHVLLDASSNARRELTAEDFRAWKIEKKKSERPTYGSPGAALEYYVERRSATGSIPAGWRRAAETSVRKNNLPEDGSRAATLDWTSLGPFNVGGRIRSLVVHPDSSNVVYAGSVSGGVWKTTDGGASWRALADEMDNLAVCSMAMDPDDPGALYAGTGEGYHNQDAVRGEGIFKTTDAGETWTRLASTAGENFYYVNQLEIDPASGAIWAGTREGLFKSADGGATWTGAITNRQHCADLEIVPTTPTTIFATFGVIYVDSRVLRSTDAGATWTVVYAPTGKGRAELGVSPADPNRVYLALTNGSTQAVDQILHSSDGGDSWSDAPLPPNALGIGGSYAGYQAWYNNILVAHPSDPDAFMVGGIDLYSTTDVGTTWKRNSNWYSLMGYEYVHADQHAIEYAPSAPNVIYAGNDGGVYRSTDYGATWRARNGGLAVTQFYSGAVHPGADVFYGGTQDNGTLRSEDDDFGEILGGDGGPVVVDADDPDNVYFGYIRMAIFKSTNGGDTYARAMDGIPTNGGIYDGTTDRVLFIAPMEADPNDARTLYAGSYRLYRTTNGAESWSAITGDVTGDGSGSTGAKISAIAVADGAPETIYVGCSNGRVMRSTDGGASWNERLHASGSFVSSIAVAPDDPATAFVAYSNYDAGAKLIRTTDGGATWTNVSGDLPNVPLNRALVNPENSSEVLVGTDMGVFVADAPYAEWTQANVGLPNVVVHDLDYRAADGLLVAATHGRGLFSARLGSGSGSLRYDLVYDGGFAAGGYSWSGEGDASASRMTAPQSGMRLESISVYFYSTGVTNLARYKPIVYGALDGEPDAPLADLDYRVAENAPGWETIDLQNANIAVDDEFFVGIAYDGTNKPKFGYQSPDNGRAWDFDGDVWSRWDETYLFRATVSTASVRVKFSNNAPDEFRLSSNFPNPFNPATTIRYSLPNPANVKLRVYDLRGRLVATLLDARQAAGEYDVRWRGVNDRGERVSSGVYLYALETDERRLVGKMTLLK
ncbi:MAG: T9SS type A sorting domain-containing protein [Ignavibacteriales bacterium]|nr:T9SS type A sorting domain-containing protein [Ignavibacteriales bacterium]